MLKKSSDVAPKTPEKQKTKSPDLAKKQKSPSKFPRQPNDYTSRCPEYWKEKMKLADMQWVGKNVLNPASNPSRFQEPMKMWNHPPPVSEVINSKPTPAEHFLLRLFLWMPRLMFGYEFKCPECKNALHSKGIHNRVRLVLDIKSYYYLATEGLSCKNKQCRKTYISTDMRLLKQLPSNIRALFPAVLTYQYACDKSIISLMRSRTLGNSTYALQNTLHEIHSEEWIKQNLQYLSYCQRYLKGQRLFDRNIQIAFEAVEEFKKIPLAQWFLSAYSRDVWSRLDIIKAEISSVFGEILKIDSTKKVLKKLAGAARNTATWVTNVGNEYGGILQCVVTSSESNDGLGKMADGLMKRYSDANVPPPLVLYADCSCCSEDDTSKYQKLFHLWPDLIIRLDIFHFMMRIALGVTSNSHPLYGPFMGKLAAAIFETDPNDYQALLDAKKEELVLAGVKFPTTEAAEKKITKAELQKHCRRRTRGVENTAKALEELILAFTGATDTLGVPLFKEGDCSMVEVYRQQKKHIPCIQDPPVSLYTQVATVKKGKRRLPVYRCARGSSSVESFHNHLPTFIPGKSAGAVNFQAYLLDGIARWNKSRKDATRDSPTLGSLRTFDSELLAKFNELHLQVHGKPYNSVPSPNKVSNEVIGIEYLYAEMEDMFDYDNLETAVEQKMEVDEGIEEDIKEEEFDFPGFGEEGLDVQEEAETELETDKTATDSRGIPGWDKVDALAKALLAGDGLTFSDADAQKILELYENLDEFDKKPITFKSVERKTSTGRYFARKPRGAHMNFVKMTRAFVSGVSSAHWPTKSRLVEAICIYLSQEVPGPITVLSDGIPKKIPRVRGILRAYQRVRARVYHTHALFKTNKLQLLNLNETTVRQWLLDTNRLEEVLLLLNGLKTPPSLRIAATSLPEPRSKPRNLEGHGQAMHFPEPEDMTGRAVLKYQRQHVRKKRTIDSTTTNSVNNFPVDFSSISPLPVTQATPPSQHPLVPSSNQQNIIQVPQIQFPPIMPAAHPIQTPRLQSNVPIYIAPATTFPVSPVTVHLQSIAAQPVYASSPFTPVVSKSTYYSRKKKGKDPLGGRKNKCTFCQQAISDGVHRRYSGYLYCPKKETFSYEEWVDKIKALRTNAK